MHVPPATANTGNGAGRAAQGVGAPWADLFDGVDDLIKRVADTENPEIRKIRAKVHASMAMAKSVFAEGDAQARHPPRRLGGDADEYSGDYPEQALGVALLVGVGLGVIMSTQP